MKKQPFTIGGSVALKKALLEETGVKPYSSETIHDYENLKPNANKTLGGEDIKSPIHYRLPEEWNEAVAAVRDFFAEEKFEAGKWYYGRSLKEEYLINVKSIKDSQVKSFGVHNGVWHDWLNSFHTESAFASLFTPATTEQIQFMLGKVAEQKGYVKGAKVKKGTVTLELSLMGYAYLDTEDILYCGSISIYEEGKWAELLPQEEAKPQTLVLKGMKITQEIDTFTASEKTVDLHLTATHLQQLKAYFNS